MKAAGKESGTGANHDERMPKYGQLMAVIEEMGRDVKSAYVGNKLAAERLKKGIVQARILVAECLIEADRSAQQ